MKKWLCFVIAALVCASVWYGCSSSAKTAADPQVQLRLDAIEKAKDIAYAVRAYYNWFGYYLRGTNCLDSIPTYPFVTPTDSVYDLSIQQRTYYGIFFHDGIGRWVVNGSANLDGDPARDEFNVIIDDVTADTLRVDVYADDLNPPFRVTTQ